MADLKHGEHVDELPAYAPALKEVYRFFILNYVIKNGNYFFSEQYAKKLQAEALDIYLPSVDRDFDPEKIIDYLKIAK
jgi:hypothetical protein